MLEKLYTLFKSPPTKDLYYRVMRKVYIPSATECWIWMAGLDKYGYPQYTLSEKRDGVVANKRVHRLLAEWMHGPKAIEGRDVDHLCNCRACINPYHTRPATRQENLVRAGSASRASANASKTCCPKGHAYTLENCSPYELRFGFRKCLTCINERKAVYRANNREKVNAQQRAAKRRSTDQKDKYVAQQTEATQFTSGGYYLSTIQTTSRFTTISDRIPVRS